MLRYSQMLCYSWQL